MALNAEYISLSFYSAAMGNSIELTTSQRFEIERFSRAIDATSDSEQLRDLAKQLLVAWHSQKAATTWAISANCSALTGVLHGDGQCADEHGSGLQH